MITKQKIYPSCCLNSRVNPLSRTRTLFHQRCTHSSLSFSDCLAVSERCVLCAGVLNHSLHSTQDLMKLSLRMYWCRPGKPQLHDDITTDSDTGRMGCERKENRPPRARLVQLEWPPYYAIRLQSTEGGFEIRVRGGKSRENIA